jgi:hypothetical protein
MAGQKGQKPEKEKADDLQEQDVRSLAFDAILAQNANAIRFHGESGAQVTFDVDDSGRDALKELVEYRGENLHIQVTKISRGS